MPDISATSLTWDRATNRVDYGYQISTTDLPTPATAGLFWSPTAAFDTKTAIPISGTSFTTAQAVGTYTGHVNVSASAAPGGAKYLLFEINPSGAVAESDAANDTNNTKSVAVPSSTLPDIVLLDAQINPSLTTLTLNYKVDGNPGTFPVSIYRSVGPAYSDDDAAYLVTTEYVTPTADSSGQKTFTFSTPLQPDASRPYLVLVANQNQTITEEYYSNNYSYVKYYHNDDISISIEAPDTALMGQRYDVKAYIKNNGSTPVTVSVDWTEMYPTSPKLKEPVSGDSLEAIVIQPGGTYTLTMNSLAFNDHHFRHRWDWAPEEEPAANKILQIEAELFDDLLKEAGAPVWAEHIANLTSWAHTVQEWINGAGAMIKASNNRDALVGYRVLVKNGSTTYSDTRDVGIDVGSYKYNNFTMYLIEDKVAVTEISAAISTLRFKATIPLGLVELAAGTLTLKDSEITYKQAVDPPDPDYTQVVSPSPLSIPEVESSTDATARQLAHLALQEAAYREAAATCVNRADEAELAGQPAWQATQLAAAASYTAQAVELGNELARSQQLLLPLLAAAAYSSPSNWIDTLKSDGLPSLVTSILTQAGWTNDQIDQFSQNMIVFGSEALADFSSNQSAQALDTALEAYEGLGYLEDAIDLRVNTLGQPVTNPSPADLQALATQHASIEAGLTAGIPLASLSAAIRSYLTQVQSLVLATNNLAALQADLDYGFTALANDQHLDAGTQGLRAYVSNLASGGKISGLAASSMLALINQADAQLGAGDLSGAQTTLKSLTAWIQGNAGGSLSTDAASGLLQYSSVVSSNFMADAYVNAPTLISLQQLETGTQTTKLVLTFSESLDASHAGNPANYTIAAPGLDGRFGTGDDFIVPIITTTYDPAKLTVTLTTAQLLSSTTSYQIRINGSSSTGVTDLSGNLLDGNNDGQPGDDYVAVFSGAGQFPTPAPSGYGAGPDAFTTSLYNEVLGRAPEPAGLSFWSKTLASRVKPKTVATAFMLSRERRMLQKDHRAPAVTLRRALTDASSEWKKAVKASAARVSGKRH